MKTGGRSKSGLKKTKNETVDGKKQQNNLVRETENERSHSYKSYEEHGMGKG